MHVAVAGVHVERDEHPAAQVLALDLDAARHHRRERVAAEDFLERSLELGLPRRDRRAVLQRGKRRIDTEIEILPPRAHGGDLHASFIHLRRNFLRRWPGVVVRAPRLQELRPGDERVQRIAQLDLVRERALDVDPLDAIGVIAEALERNDDVLVDLERVRVPGDRRGARAILPEFLARLGRHRDEALAAAGIGDPDHFRSGLRHRHVVVADDVAQQHHFRPAVAPRLGRVTHGLHVALVQMLEPREDRACGPRVEVALDLDDRRHRIANLPEELEAHRADRRRHPVQHESRGGDEPVATLLLHTGQASEELVGDVLAESRLAESSAGNRQRLLAPQRGAVGVVPGELERRDGGVVDLAEIVVRSRDFQPFGIGRDHPPRDEIVERRPPQHRLLAAGVHRDVAADARGVGGRRVDGEDQPFGFRRLHHALGHDTRAAVDRRDGRPVRADRNALDRREAHQLLGVDDRRARSEWNGAARIARAAAARDDREPELDAARDERARLLLGVGEQDDERILDAPIGGVGDVRHAREAIERDVVFLRRAAEHAHGLCPERHGVAERALEAQHGGARRSNELRHIEVALGIGVAACQRILLPPLLDLVQPMHQRHDEEPPALRVVDQVVLQIGIALDDPDVAQHLEEHSRGATRAPLAAQLLQHVP